VAPSGSRTSACHWVSRGNLKILFDCGAGALHRLAQFGLPWHQITHVVLSHFHPDHWGELPMLVYALKYTAVPARQEPSVIRGPPGVARLLKRLAACRARSAPPLASSATTGGSTRRASKGSPACRTSSTSPSPTSR